VLLTIYVFLFEITYYVCLFDKIVCIMCVAYLKLLMYVSKCIGSFDNDVYLCLYNVCVFI
jgi:hypothetical protein